MGKRDLPEIYALARGPQIHLLNCIQYRELVIHAIDQNWNAPEMYPGILPQQWDI